MPGGKFGNSLYIVITARGLRPLQVHFIIYVGGLYHIVQVVIVLLHTAGVSDCPY